MSEETWQRHTNPWSVWTRIIILPIFILILWYQSWLGIWTIILLAIIIIWTWLNPRVFAKPHTTNNWASKAVLGERIWINHNNIPIPTRHRMMAHLLSLLAFSGLPFLTWGIWQQSLWPTLFGCLLVYSGKLWFLDRMVWLFEDMKTHPQYANWLYDNNKNYNA